MTPEQRVAERRTAVAEQETRAAHQCPVHGCNNDSVAPDVHGYCLVHRHMYHHARRQP